MEAWSIVIVLCIPFLSIVSVCGETLTTQNGSMVFGISLLYENVANFTDFPDAVAVCSGLSIETICPGLNV